MNNAFGVAGAFRIEFHAENENQSRHGGRLLDNRWLSTRRPHELHFRHFTAPQHHLDSYLFIPMSLFLLDTMRREEIKTFFFFYASRWNERCGDGSMVVGGCVKIEIWDVSRLFFATLRSRSGRLFHLCYFAELETDWRTFHEQVNHEMESSATQKPFLRLMHRILTFHWIMSKPMSSLIKFKASSFETSLNWYHNVAQSRLEWMSFGLLDFFFYETALLLGFAILFNCNALRLATNWW